MCDLPLEEEINLCISHPVERKRVLGMTTVVLLSTAPGGVVVLMQITEPQHLKQQKVAR